MEAKMSELRLELPSPQVKALTSHAAKQNKVVDSWEDDDISDQESGLHTPIREINPLSPDGKELSPAIKPPPPTPMSPRSDNGFVDWTPANNLGGGRPQTYGSIGSPTPSRGEEDQDRKRPEKTTATANRMIAASLGLKVPKKTEDQIKYDRAAKEQEIKRRNREKEEKQKEAEDIEKAKAAVWNS